MKPCPPLKEYTAEEQARAAADVDSLAPDSPVRMLVDDYHAMREACR